MNTTTKRHGNGIAGVLATLALVIVIACGTIYAMGYATVENSPQSTTIEVNTQQMKEDAGKAVEDGKQLLNDAGQSIEEGAEEVQESVTDEPEAEIDVDVDTKPAPETAVMTDNE